MKRSTSRFFAFALVALGALWWLTLGPQFLGGPADYVIVSGRSMEPTLFTGDLAVVRRQSEYEVGDVVAFRVDGGAVIHRIVGGDAESGFVMLGDNNPSIDRWRPTPAEISGTMWFHVPDAGGWLGRLRSPQHLNVFAAVVLAMMIPVGGGRALRQSRSRRKRMATHDGSAESSGTSGLGSLPPLPGALLFPLAVGIGAVLLFAAIGFSAFRATSSEAQFVERLAYEQTGEFDYHLVMEPSRLYPGGLISPRDSEDGGAALGQPIYTNLARELVVRFNYALDTAQEAELAGTLGLELAVRAGDGWTQVPVTVPATSFSGGAASGELRVRLTEISSLIASLEAETGFKPNLYELLVSPTVDVSGTIAGEPVTERFNPTLRFGYTETEITPGVELAQFEPTSIGESIEVANQYSPLGLSMTVARWRQAALAGLVAGLVVVAIAMAVWLLGLGRDEDGKIEARYHSMLLRVQPGQAGPSGNVTRLATMHDLVRLARRDGGIIFMERGLRGTRYFVREGDESYEYTTGRPADPTSRPFPSISDLAPDR